MFMWKFLDSGRAKKSEVLTFTSSNLARVQEMTRFQNSMKGPGQKLTIIACE
jgi:hypothetical protein